MRPRDPMLRRGSRRGGGAAGAGEPFSGRGSCFRAGVLPPGPATCPAPHGPVHLSAAAAPEAACEVHRERRGADGRGRDSWDQVVPPRVASHLAAAALEHPARRGSPAPRLRPPPPQARVLPPQTARRAAAARKEEGIAPGPPCTVAAGPINSRPSGPLPRAS